MTDSLAALAHAAVDSIWNRRRFPHHAFAAGATIDLQGDVVEVATFEQRTVPGLLAALPDLRVRIRGTLSGDAEVALRMICTGTHAGTLFSVPATGRTVSFSATVWIYFEGQLVRHARLDWNALRTQEPLWAARRELEARTLDPGNKKV